MTEKINSRKNIKPAKLIYEISTLLIKNIIILLDIKAI